MLVPDVSLLLRVVPVQGRQRSTANKDKGHEPAGCNTQVAGNRGHGLGVDVDV